MENPELDFEKARFEYNLNLFESLKARKDAIEKRVAFELLIITLMLGLIFSNVNSITKLNDYLMANKDIKLLFFSNMLFFLLAVALVLSLTFIIIVLFRSQTPDSPSKDLLTSIYFSDAETSQHKDPIFFYQRVGVAYSVIIERFASEINRNEMLCRLSTISLAAAILILGMVIIAFTLGIPVP
jgi:hypothetical protein